MTFSLAAASKIAQPLDAHHFAGHLRDSHSQLPPLRRDAHADRALAWLSSANGGGFGGLFQLGSIDGHGSDPLRKLMAARTYNVLQPWRFVMAIFLHGSLLHIGFNMWVLMDVGPLVEEVYGSARYLFIYVATGVAGYVLSSWRRQFIASAARARCSD